MNSIVNVSIINMRNAPNSSAEMASQALFAEEIKVISNNQNWIEIETVHDGYRGFIRYHEESLISKDSNPYTDQTKNFILVSRLFAHVYKEPDTIFGPMLTLPFGCRLQVFKAFNEDSRWISVILPDSKVAYIQSGDVTANHSIFDRHETCEMSFKFLGLPYTWGGRSSFGFDCSGLVQMLYKQMGITLPRDSRDQFSSPLLKDRDLNHLEPGDLIFYGDQDMKIKHVGLCLGNKQFIHTSAVTENMPYVRISSIEDPAWNGSGYYPTLFGKTLK